jgi:hypothetical protein
MRHFVVSGAIVVAFAAFLFAQDKSAPALKGEVENKFILLANAELNPVNSKQIARQYVVDTAGYSEMRISFYVNGADDKGGVASIGANAKREIEVLPTLSNQKRFLTLKPSVKATTDPSDALCADTYTVKVCSPTTAFKLWFKDVDCAKMIYSVEVYLVK